MLILPYLREIPLLKGMGVSVVEIDVMEYYNNKEIFTITYEGMVTSTTPNEYTYVNKTQFNQKVFKGSKNLYIA